MTPLIKWLGVCVVAAGLTFIAFANAARFLPMRIESTPKIDVQDYVNTRVQARPNSYSDIAAYTFHDPVYEAPKFPYLTPNQPALPEFTKKNLNDSMGWKSPMIVASHAPMTHVVRIPPIMPDAATKSGHCKVMFDVDEEGNTFNIQATSCSEDKFAPTSINSVKHWRYPLKIVAGKPVSRKRVETKISYKLVDEDGNHLPE